ncbi:MAG: type II secretion system protein [Planctomycetota bacterium]|jgi:prepilin-type N-terminal cleavage/methylation domain-containing protein
MSMPVLQKRSGFTMLELMLALAITALVAVAISGMLAAVSTGVGSRRDNRSVMVHANAAQTRLAAYVAPSRCVLLAEGSDLVLWLDDSRESGTVHASEIRWLLFNDVEGTIDVHYLDFPVDWTDVASALADEEHPAASDWHSIRQAYEANGLISTVTVVDGLDWVLVDTDGPTDLESHQVMYDLGFETTNGTAPARVTGAIRLHHLPTS